MKLRFSIAYITAWGESVHIDLQYISGDGTHRRLNIPMNTDDGIMWTAETMSITSPLQRNVTAICYAYQVENGGGEVVRREFDVVPRLIPIDVTRNYTLNDGWRDIPMMSHLFTAVYQHKTDSVKAVQLPLFRKTAFFRLSAPQIKKGHAIAVVGDHPSVGDWSPTRYLPMQYVGQAVWTLSLNVEAVGEKLEYKYVVIDPKTHSLVEWEGGDNRTASFHKMDDGEVRLLDGGNLRIQEQQWKAAGVAIPVFSLRSEHSCGVGDFGDLKRFVDWATATGIRIIQTLPINDTTMQHNWNDSYPYNTISVNALHPQYVDLEAAGSLENSMAMNQFNRQRQELNNSQVSDYEAVERVKTKYLRQLYKEKKESLMSDDAYKAFKQANSEWLMPYAAFCILRDRFHTARFTDWKEYAKYNHDKVRQVVMEEYEEAEYVYYVQYLLHVQLKAAADYAKENGVVLMGDIPVGISHDSVEAWAESKYFNLDSQIGSPPDNYNPKGQNWCFPTYHWDNMMADGCQWWRKRLARMEQYYDAFRIDHVLGFFRVWELPESSVDGLLGHFSPSMPYSAENIEYFGLRFRKELYTKPLINDDILRRIFGIHAQYVRDHYLVGKGFQLYDLKPAYDTQKKIRASLGDCRDESSIWIRDGLYRLVAGVLFTEDPRWKGHYHPRIRAYEEPIFEMLSPDDRAAFMRLYNDYYFERHNDMWGNVASRRLSMMMSGTRMLACAEDLGQLPACVAPVLNSIRILTLEVQTLPKEKGYEFAHLEANPYLSMATISTHDMPPLRLWWEELPDRTQRYYNTMLQKEGRAPEQLTAMLAGEIVARHLYCPSMLCILSFQDWTSIDSDVRNKNLRQERINVPGDCYNHWQYRMHLTIEQLLEERRFNDKIKSMISGSRRI